MYDEHEQQFNDAVTVEDILQQYPDPTISIRHILVMAEQDDNGEWTDDAKEAAKRSVELDEAYRFGRSLA